jgi:hypothetical protein
MKLSEDSYKFLDLFLKGFFGVVVTAAIAYYSIASQNNREEMARQSNQRTATVEFISKQKDLDITQNMRLFENLMGHYFQKDASQPGPQDPKERLVLLRLIALNFQDIPINLKPLYQQLDGQLADNKDRDDLKDVGREVARRQAYRLTATNGQDLGVWPLKAGEPIEIPSLQLKLLADEITNDHIKVQFDFGAKTVGPIKVTYFDMPLVDNTKLGDVRMSLILLEADEKAKTAAVRVIAFENYLAMDRFDVKDLTVPLGLKNESESR